MKLSGREEEKALELHRKYVVIDSHSDLPLDVTRRRLTGENRVLERYHVPRLTAGGVSASSAVVWCDCGAQAFGTTDPAALIAMRAIDLMEQEFAESSHLLMKVETAREIREAKKMGKIGLFYAIEGAKPLGESVGNLRNFYNLGLRLVQLVWDLRNFVADGLRERSKSGLSNFGYDLVNELNRLGVIIDLSHISTAGFFDVLETSKDPVIASHANVRAVCDHPRNLTDEMIKALAEKGGMQGMCAFPPHISQKEPSVEKLLDHVDYITKLVGADHVGLGFDFAEYFVRCEYELHLQAMGTVPRNPEALMSSGPAPPRGLEDASKTVNITRGLVARGYSDQEIEKILGGNYLRIFERVFGE